MTYISLYRKYRPQTFDHVIGQEHIVKTLCNAIEKSEISHAYLFCGPRGTGKTSVAKILAKAVNCKQGPTLKPCNKCDLCIGITSGNLVDVLEIDAASNRGIDEIRDLKEKVYFAPTQARFKVYIIDEVHMLTTEAFNALLKMLEEPPSSVIFILATTQVYKVLPTILSRCMRFDFRRIPVSNIKDRLKQVADQEKIKINDNALLLIAERAQGSLRDALGTLDQLSSFTKKNITEDDINTFLGLFEEKLLAEMTGFLKDNDTSQALLFLEQLIEGGRDLKQFNQQLIEYLRNLFIIQNTKEFKKVINASPESLDKMKSQAKQLNSNQVTRFIQVLTETAKNMRYTPNSRMILEGTLVRLTQPQADSSLEGLHTRLSQLELAVEKLNRGDTAFKEQADHKPNSKKSPETKPSPEKKAISEKPHSELAPISPQETEAEAEAVETEPSPPDTEKQPKASNQKESTQPASTQAEIKNKDTVASSNQAESSHSPLNIEKIKRVWPLVLENVKKAKISTYALLLECRPADFINGSLVLEFGKEAVFHKGEIEKSHNLLVIKDSFQEVLKQNISISCLLKEASKASTEEHNLKSAEPEENLSKQEPEIGIPEFDPVKLAEEKFNARIAGDEQTNDQIRP